MFGNKEKQADFEFFALYDSKTQTYNMPMAAVNQFDMVRQVETLMRDPAQTNNQYILNSEDFALFKIGAYSKKLGQFFGQTPEHIINLHELKAALQSKQGIVST